MKLHFFIIFIFIQFSIIFGDITYNYGHPDHPGKCFYEGLILTPGIHKKAQEKTCMQIDCQADGWATIKICPFRRPATKCRFTGYVDIKKDYPDCCEKIQKCV